MTERSIFERALGPTLVALTAIVILHEWGATWAGDAAALLTLVAIALLATMSTGSRIAFLLVALALTIALAARSPDWLDTVRRALSTTAFIATFFTALSTLRRAAQASPAIQASGRYLASQPPGRRYLALTSGGMMFALLLNYGAIALLGTLATTSGQSEPDPVRRNLRTRRMLIAIQRGFIATLPWSPMSYAVAISTAQVPGSAWANLVIPGLVTSVLMAGTGWAIDTIFKPRLPGPARSFTPEGTWHRLLPLAMLLALLVGLVSVLHLVTDVRIVGVVMALVPLIAIVWLVIQTRDLGETLVQSGRYLAEELPSYRKELVLLMMAGYIGTVGSALLVPMITAAGFDLSGVPGWVVLAALVWLIPLTGQIGMNPILTVTLFAPLIPSAAALGTSPTAIVVAITSGWALSGITSPFTATTLLIGSFGGISAFQVGTRWNGVYFLVTSVLLTGWVLAFAALSA